MKHQKSLRNILLCAVLMLCMVLCTACGEDAEVLDLGEYFSQEDIKSWKKEDKDCKYTMNGGYFISFQGQLYPVEFEAGTIHWKTTPPDELFYVELSELYTDSALTKRCAYLGHYKEEKLFTTGIHHEGFLLDGDRPAYGSVLYLDETDMKVFTIRNGGLRCRFGPDEEGIGIFGAVTGNRLEALYYHLELNLILSDETGVFLEDYNTIRKICEYARASNIPFDAYTEFTNLPYPSILFQDYVNRYERSTYMDVCALEISDKYHISIHYLSESLRDLNCVVFTESEAIQTFYSDVDWGLANPDYEHNRYQNVVMDDKGRITQYFDKYFHGSTMGKDNSAQVDHVFYSMEEFNEFVEQLAVIDPETKQSLYFSTKENGKPFNGTTDYNPDGYNTGRVSLYAVWKDYHTLNLHTPGGTSEEIVCVNQQVRLPLAMQPGCEFEGWYADESYSGQSITQVSYEDSVTDLYAKFRKVDSYTLTFEPYDGKTFENIQYVYGDMVSLPYLSKPFHIFKGWCVDPACETEPHKTISGEFYGSFHLYPAFEPQVYTITVIVGEKTLQSTVRYGESYTLLTHIAEENFIGYFDADGVQYTDENGKSLVPFTDGADIQLFAKYKEG